MFDLISTSTLAVQLEREYCRAQLLRGLCHPSLTSAIERAHQNRKPRML